MALIRIADRFPRGSVRLARLLTAVRPSLRRYPAQTRYGTIICDVSETACYGLAVRREISHWKADEDAISRIPLNEQSVVLDIGANIGVMTRIFAARAGHVHAFEPAPRALALLRENAPSNCTVHPIAIGDHEGIAHFAELEALDESHLAENGVEVPMRTVDSLELECDLIKIDVEGYEPDVLRGATETLKRGPMLMFEALTAVALDQCVSIVLAANPNYRFQDMGSGQNFFASVDAHAVPEVMPVI